MIGGKGTRVKKFTKKNPKCLIKFNKKPFLYYQLRYLKKSGIDNVLLSTCYMTKKIISYVRSNINFINVKIVNDGKPLGTGGAILKSLKFMEMTYELLHKNDIKMSVGIYPWPAQILPSQPAFYSPELQTVQLH